MSQPSGPLVPDSVQLVVPITLIGPAEAIDLTNAVVGDPTLERTIDGATTLTMDVLDYDRRLVAAHRAGRSFAIVQGLQFELRGLTRREDVVTMTFEDAVVAALRRRTSPRVFAAGSTTRAGIATALGAEASVTVLVDPAYNNTVGDAVTRNSDADGTAKRTSSSNKDTSWSLLSALAGARDGRCFSDGSQVFLGGDDWLMSRLPAVSIAEFTGAVNTIDFEFDVNQENASIEVELDVDAWTVPPGVAVKVTDPGPHNGAYLLTKLTRGLHETHGTLSAERPQPTLMEPAPSGGTAAGESGELDFLASGKLGPDAVVQSVRAAEAAAGPLGRFLNFALQQSGKKYLWGASGPNTFDCSGLVQQSAAAAGYRFPKPARDQLRLCQQGAARMMTVKDALATRGALLFRIDYPGAGDHVAISLGNGTTMEARGAAYGCGIFDQAPARRWNAGAMLTFTGRSAVSSSGPI